MSIYIHHCLVAVATGQLIGESLSLTPAAKLNFYSSRSTQILIDQVTYCPSSCKQILKLFLLCFFADAWCTKCSFFVYVASDLDILCNYTVFFQASLTDVANCFPEYPWMQYM